MAIPNPYGSLGTIWSEVGLDYTKFDQGAAEVARKTEELDRATQAAVESMGRHWEKYGTVLSVSVTAPLTALAAQFTRTFMSFEQSMANTAAVANASAEELRRLTEAAREAGATTQFSASQAADALYYMAAAGLSVSDSVAGLSGVLDLAAATQSDLAFSSATVTAALSQFNLEASEATRVANLFAAAMSSSQATIDKLANSMRYAGPIAAGFGFSIEETTAALSLLYNAGLQGEQAGTTLRAALQQLANPVGQTTEALEKLGLTADDVNPALHSLADIIETLERAGMDTATAMMLFGSQAGSGMATLVRQGSEALRQMTEDITGTDAASRMAATQMDTLRGSMLEMSSAFEELSISLAERFTPALRGVVDRVTELLRWMAELPPAVQSGAIAFSTMLAAVGPLTLALRGLQTTLAILTGPGGMVGLLIAGVASLGFAMVTGLREVDEMGQVSTDTARAFRDQAAELEGLIQRYDELSGKPGLSQEEHAELDKVMRRIAEIQPELVAGYDDLSEALQRNIDPLREYTEALRQQSDMELELAAMRAEFARAGLELERDQIQAEIEMLRGQLGPEFERATERLRQLTEARRLLAKAEADAAAGMEPSEAFRELWSFLDEVVGPGGTPATQFAVLEQEVQRAERLYGNIFNRIQELQVRQQQINERLRAGQIAIEMWQARRRGEDPFAVPETRQVPPQQDPIVKAVITSTNTLEEAVQKENVLWQARLSLIRAGVEEYIDQYGDLETAIASYLEWLDEQVRREDLAEETRGRLANSIVSLQRELSSLLEKAKADTELTAEEITERIFKMIDQFGTAREHLLRAVTSGELPFIGDNLEEAERRITNFYQHLVDIGRISLQEHLGVLQFQLESLTAAGETASDQWMRITAEIQQVQRTIALEGDRAHQEMLRRQEERVRGLVEQINRQARLEDWSASQTADAIQRVLQTEEMSARTRSDLAYQVALLRKRAAEEAAAAEERAAREAERRAQEEAERARRLALEEERVQDQRVRDRVTAIQRIAYLEEWSLFQVADALQSVLDTESMTARLRADLAWEVARTRKQAADQAAAEEKRAAELAEQEARRRALEEERAAQQAAKERDDRVRQRVQQIERTATLEKWALTELADAIEEVLGAEAMSASLRSDLAYKVALLRVRAADEAAAAEKRAAEEAAREAERRAQEAERAAQEEARRKDQLVRDEAERIRRIAYLEDWSLEQQADALQGLIDLYEMSARLQEDLAFEVASKRKQAADQARAEAERAAEREAQERERLAREAERKAEEAARAEEQARAARVRAALAEAQHQARLYEWTAARHADALQQILETHETNEQERLEITRRIELLRKQHLDDMARAEEAARSQALRAELDQARFLAQLHQWSGDRYAEELERILEAHEVNAEERTRIEREAALARELGAREALRQAERDRAEHVRRTIEQIERQAEREGWSAQKLAEALAQQRDVLNMTADERLRLEDKIFRLEERYRQERQRQDEEWNRFLVASGRMAAQALLQQEVQQARERLMAAQEAGEGILEAERDVQRAQYALDRQILDDRMEFYQTMVAMERLSTEERLEFIRELAEEERRLQGDREEGSHRLRQLAQEEIALRRQLVMEQLELRLKLFYAEEASLSMLVRQKGQLEVMREEYAAMGQDGVEALRKIESELLRLQYRLDRAIARHPAMVFVQQLRSVLSGDQTFGEGLEAAGRYVVRYHAGLIIDDLSERMAKFIELSTRGAKSFGEAWAEAFQGFRIRGTSALVILVSELLSFFSNYNAAVRRLEAQVEADRQKRLEDEKRFAELIAAGFVGTFETTTQYYTERVSYFFGLFHTNVTRSVQVTSEETKRWIERMEELFRQLQQVGQASMRDAFRMPPGHEMPVFLRSLRQGVYDSVVTGLVEAFSQHSMFTRVMAPLWQAMDEAMEQSFIGSTFDPQRWWAIMGPALEEFQGQLGRFEAPLAAMRRVLAELQAELGLPFTPDTAVAGGTRLTQLTGEQRDFFGELMRPLKILDRHAGWHDAHMARLDRIIEILEASGPVDFSGDIQRFIHQEQAVIHAGQVTVEYIARATFTGEVNVRVGEEDLREALRRIQAEEERNAFSATRAAGLG